MAFSRVLFLVSVAAFVGIGGMAFFKKRQLPASDQSKAIVENQELAQPTDEEVFLDQVNHVPLLFATGQQKLPIVETITYKSRVPWLTGKPAWISDYAAHFRTSRHFIARSLNGRPDYETQKIATGDRFNVLRNDKEIEFYLVASLAQKKMRFYYFDVENNERMLLKTYPIGIGRDDIASLSGSLTPMGRYSLGQKVGIYKPGMMGFYQNSEVELVRIFGTRWIPFDEEISGCTDRHRGYGLHGAPWYYVHDQDKWEEERNSVGTEESDGCVRLLKEDIEELFAIVITRKTYIDVVRHFKDALLPGREVHE